MGANLQMLSGHMTKLKRHHRILTGLFN